MNFPLTFNPLRALNCALLSRRAYSEMTWTCDQTDTQVLVDEQPGAIHVAFRGTNDLHKWITDAEFLRVPARCGAVHHGFSNACASILPALVDGITKTCKPASVYFTGHSLGGALAQLAAYNWHWQYRGLEDWPVAGVYTFGQPRVGNSRWADDCDARLGSLTWRAIHDLDLVPRLPGLIAGYRHAGHEYLFDSFGRTEFDPSLVTKLISDAWVITRSKWKTLPQLIEDHRIDHYVEHLKGLQPQ